MEIQILDSLHTIYCKHSGNHMDRLGIQLILGWWAGEKKLFQVAMATEPVWAPPDAVEWYAGILILDKTNQHCSSPP